MADIFQEVDEEVRREQFKKLWDKYGIYVLAVAVFVVAGVGAWRAYEWWQVKKAAEASTKFEMAVLLSEQGKHEEAQQAFARLATEGTPGYRVLARFREAAELADRDPKTAVGAYDAIAGDSSVGQPLQDLAALRAGLLLVDAAPFDELTRRMEPLSGSGAPFRHTARELLALSAWRVGDMAAVRRWSELVRNDPETPADVRARVDVLMALASESGKG